MTKIIDHISLVSHKTLDPKILAKVNSFFKKLKKERKITIIMNNHEYPLK